VSGELRDGPAARELGPVVGVTADPVVVPDRPTRIAPRPTTGGRPRTRHRLADGNPPPVGAGELAGRRRRREVAWRAGAGGKRAARLAWARVRPGHDRRRGGCAGAGPAWLLAGGQAGGPLEYAPSNRPPDTSRRTAARRWEGRWPVERGYRQLRAGPGLDPFEGRAGRGFRRHAALTLLAYGSPLLEQLAAPPPGPRRGGKGGPRVTRPGVRRAPQHPPAPPARSDCVYCRARAFHPRVTE
jgi:SRSO17 transposase